MHGIMFALLLSVVYEMGRVTSTSRGDVTPEVVYQWNIIEYEWPNETLKQQEINNNNYLPNNSAVNGIKLYRNRVYVTVPRLKDGVPSTLNVIIDATSENTDANVSHILRPYPSWEMQELGNCDALQIVQSMEIDPHTGYMWVIDTGSKPSGSLSVQPVDRCPAKIIIYDLTTNKEVHRYIFPPEVVGQGLYYLNDIVLGFSEGKARYAFISDTLAYKLVVYDYVDDTSYAYSHSSMAADPAHKNITINNMTLPGIVTGINGIAMSPDYQYVYYSAVAGVGLHQIETSVLISAKGDNAAFAAAVRTLGDKISPGDGMAYSDNHNLYYSALGPNAVYHWDIKTDLNAAGGDFNKIQLISHSELVSHMQMEWVDTLAIDNGYLWFTTSRLQKFFSTDGIVHHEPNFFIWKLHIGENSYLTKTGPTLGTSCVTASVASMATCVLVYLLS